MATILVTGGTGRTGRRVANALKAKGIKARIASRSVSEVEGHESVRFDWMDPSTWDAALQNIKAIYLVAPTGAIEPLPIMQPFLEKAMKDGVKRFVLLSATIYEEDGILVGPVHGYLRRTAPEWTALRPSWFMQGFTEGQHSGPIKDLGKIFSATKQGRLSFISCADVAAVAVEALIADVPFNQDIKLSGPQALSYDEVAQIFTRVLGKPVEHVHITGDQMAEDLKSKGVPEAVARLIARMDTDVAVKDDQLHADEVEKIIGRKPIDLQTFIKQEWPGLDSQ